MFISLDGVDGSGKSTQHRLLCDWLREQRLDVVACRDPGTTAAGDALRELILRKAEISISPRTEMLLYMASRAELVDEVIRPAIEEGKTVVSDRYLLANVVYQGHALGLDVEELWQIGKVATDGVLPDLTLVLDLPTDKAAKRMARALDRVEQRGSAFQQRVREGFLRESCADRNHIAVVDASASIDKVQGAIRAIVQKIPGLFEKVKGR